MKAFIFTSQSRWSIQALAWLQLTIGLTACAQPGFECGREVPGKPGTFRRCDEFNEICVCYTNSCAEVVPKVDPHPKAQPAVEPDAGNDASAPAPPKTDGKPEFCASGYRYVDAPFASKPNTCVEQWELDLSGDAGILDQAKGELMCPGAPRTPTPDDSTSRDAPDSGAHSSSNTVPDAMTLDPTMPDAAPNGTVSTDTTSSSSATATDATSSSVESLAQTSSLQSSSSDSLPTDAGTVVTGESTARSVDASVSAADSSSASNASVSNGLDASPGSSL